MTWITRSGFNADINVANKYCNTTLHLDEYHDIQNLLIEQSASRAACALKRGFVCTF